MSSSVVYRPLGAFFSYPVPMTQPKVTGAALGPKPQQFQYSLPLPLIKNDTLKYSLNLVVVECVGLLLSSIAISNTYQRASAHSLVSGDVSTARFFARLVNFDFVNSGKSSSGFIGPVRGQ